MAGRIAQSSTTHPSVMAFVGDGHVRGITQHLDLWDLDHEVIRLSEIRQEDLTAQPEGTTPPGGQPEDAGTTITYTYSINE